MLVQPARIGTRIRDLPITYHSAISYFCVFKVSFRTLQNQYLRKSGHPLFSPETVCLLSQQPFMTGCSIHLTCFVSHFRKDDEYNRFLIKMQRSVHAKVHTIQLVLI